MTMTRNSIVDITPRAKRNFGDGDGCIIDPITGEELCPDEDEDGKDKEENCKENAAITPAQVSSKPVRRWTVK